jgi:5-(carboxyamino)imidazole ribonucleotide synthase
MAVSLAEALRYEGILCVEFFVLKDDVLIINEIAPRPHNSGHFTIDACNVSQFEQQVRVMCGLPLSKPIQHVPAVMVNLLGDLWTKGEPDWYRVLQNDFVRLHLYNKDQPRSGRKMGHLTVVDADLDKALASSKDIKALLK